jgi:hypothetical protein
MTQAVMTARRTRLRREVRERFISRGAMLSPMSMLVSMGRFSMVGGCLKTGGRFVILIADRWERTGRELSRPKLGKRL